MLAFGVLEILILLFVFGIGAAVITAFANATGNGKLFALVLVGCLAFLALLVGTGVIFMYASMRAPQEVATEVMHMTTGPNGASQVVIQPDPHYVNVGTSNNGHTEFHASSRFSFFGLFVIIGLVAVVISAIRRRSCGGHPVRWPALIALPIIVLFFLTRVSYQTSVSHEQAQTTVERMVAEQHKFIEKQKANIDEAQRIATANIHDLEEKFVAPRIPLAPTPESPPTVPLAESTKDRKPVPAELVSDNTAVETPPADASDSKEKDLPNEKAEEPNEKSKTGDDAATKRDDDNKSNAEKQKRAKTKNDDKPASESAPRQATTPEPQRSTDEQKPPQVATLTPPPAAANARPAWVDQPAKDIGDVQRDKIVTDEYSSEEECRRARDVALMVKTHRHLCELVGLPHDEETVNGQTLSGWNISDYRYRELANMGITADYIRREVATEEYLEKTERSVGPMLRLHTLIQFSPAVDRELLSRWQAHQRQERFAIIGLGAFSVLGLLSMVWGVLKVDTLTKGYYSKRLFFGVPLAILGLLGFYVMLVEMGFKLPH